MAVCHSLWAYRGQHYLTSQETSTGNDKQALRKVEAFLGHRFSDQSLVFLALTHSSATDNIDSYERLEFLGDRILGLVLADEYYHRCPNDNEGQLSLRLHALAKQSSLVDIARGLDLAPLIKTQAGMDAEANESVLADVVESLIAALYLDGGLETAKAFILAHWDFQTGPIGVREKDAKSRLQEDVLARGLDLPVYKLIEKTGPDHAPHMVYEVHVTGMPPVSASAGSRKLAEQQAAELMLRQLRSKDIRSNKD